MAEAVRFELTEHFCSSVFKTGAINRTLPRFQCFGRGYWIRTSDDGFKDRCLRPDLANPQQNQI